jgi:acetyl esterase/lipase
VATALPILYPLVAIGGVPVDVVTPKNGIAERNRNRVLINMHGGGFIGKCPDGLVEAMPIAGTGRIEVITIDISIC